MVEVAGEVGGLYTMGWVEGYICSVDGVLCLLIVRCRVNVISKRVAIVQSIHDHGVPRSCERGWFEPRSCGGDEVPDLSRHTLCFQLEVLKMAQQRLRE